MIHIETIEKCSICGKHNKRQYWVDFGTIVEDYYYCDSCGYFYEVAYGAIHDGIKLFKHPLKLIKQLFTLLKNRKNICGLGFDEIYFG